MILLLIKNEDNIEVTLELSALVTTATTFNVFAETKDGKDDQIIVVNNNYCWMIVYCFIINIFI